MKQQLEVCILETKKEPLHEELTILKTQIKACNAAIAGVKSNQTAIMVLIFSTKTNFLLRD